MPVHPRLLDLGFLTVNGYGLMIALAIPTCYALVSHEARRAGLKALEENLVFLFFWLVAAFYLGGKLAFIIGYPSDCRALLDTQGVPGLLREGFVFYGAVLFGIPITWLGMRRYGIPFARGLDVIVYVVPLGHVFGRVGCFLAGCCYGCRTDGAWAVTFPEETMGLAGVPVHPVQLYEAAANLGVFAILWWGVRKHYRFPGQALLTYLALYAAIRFLTEFVRGDGNPVYVGEGAGDQLGAPPNGLTQAQIIAMVTMAVAGPSLWLKTRKHPGGNR